MSALKTEKGSGRISVGNVVAKSNEGLITCNIIEMGLQNVFKKILSEI